MHMAQLTVIHLVTTNISAAQSEAFLRGLSGGRMGTSFFPLPFDPAAEAWCEAQFGGRAFVILNPGAGWGAKCWPAERYAALPEPKKPAAKKKR